MLNGDLFISQQRYLRLEFSRLLHRANVNSPQIKPAALIKADGADIVVGSYQLNAAAIFAPRLLCDGACQRAAHAQPFLQTFQYSDLAIAARKVVQDITHDAAASYSDITGVRPRIMQHAMRGDIRARPTIRDLLVDKSLVIFVQWLNSELCFERWPFIF